MTSYRWTSVLAGVLLLLFSTLWAVFVSRPNVAAIASPLDRLEATLLDARYTTFGPVAPVSDVVIVAIDDATLDSTQDNASDSRLLLANVVHAIADANPRALGLDIILADAGDPVTDNLLATALQRSDTVLAAAGRFAEDQEAADLARPVSVLRPQQVFLRSAKSGLVNLSTDATGTPRYLPAVFQTPQGVEPAFALLIASAFAEVEPTMTTDAVALGDNRTPLDIGFNLPLRLVGPTASIPTFSAVDVLTGQVSDALTGKAVLLGYTATAFGDRFPNPFDENVPGVEIMATAVSQLLGGETLRRDAGTRRVDTAAAVVLALLVTVPIIALPLSSGVPLAIGALGLWLAVVWFAFSAGVWLSASIPLACASVPILAASSLRYFNEKRSAARGARALAALKQFQSPALAERIADDPAFLARPTEHRLSVFFVDLSAFTNLSEKLGPARTQDLLKQFHQITAQTVEANGGIVLNYMGDGALAIFGMAEGDTNGPDEALRAGFDLMREIERLGPEMAKGLPVGCRIGLHHGDVVLSRLGGDRHQQVSVAGDTVNLASRLLEIAKDEGAALAVTDVLLGAAKHPPERPSDAIKTVDVRGRESTAQVHFWRASP
ncbi:CHASE2 domain-containing protein [uncultured Roseobacter sp.]|uniref:CHASE2 domain-containing protein n=1 Tax=uncultured Roseobacter sp. TaxID=114847 RepID=UPI002613A7C2|nr:adenylate/guanylate cyclase domain-containing protein [uncultured Roseobacter sp.]